MLRKYRFLIALTILVMASLTCALPNSTGPKTSPSSDQAPTGAPKSNSSSIPSNPIGLRRGLSSLNGYRLTIRSINNGPTSQNKNQVTIKEESGSDKKSSHVQYETISSSPDNPQAKSSTSDRYTIGNHQCNFSSNNSKVAISDMDPMAKELMNTWYTLIEFVPMVNEPVFIGEEDVNGVRTNHFKFKANGLGVDSGAEVISSDGEYWLAQDGQYIVKYSVVIETRIGPAGDANTKGTMHSEFYIEVKDINQPITIAFPQTCNEAASASPTPSNQNAQAPTEIPAVNPTTVPNPAQASFVDGFAGFWDTKYGDMTCAVDGEKVNCSYTHNAGRIEAFLNPDGRSLEGSWFEAPTYKPADHAGRMVMTLSADGNSFTGQWWYGPAGEGGTWTGTRKADSASTNNGSALFEDDFSTPNKTIWPEDSDENHFMGFSEGGKYGITILNPRKIAVAIPSVPLNAETMTDVVVEFTATIVDGWESDTGYYEVGCRRTGDGGYAVLFYNGYYTVEYENAKTNISLLKSKWVKTTAIQQYDNRVKVSCIGSTITVWVNDQLLVQASDPQARAKSGFVWLGAGSFDKPSPNGVKVLFDDFRVSIP